MRNEATPYGGEHPFPPVREQGSGYAVLDEESGERFVAPAEFAGYALHDPLGREIGKVAQAAENKAKEMGVDLSQVEGTGVQGRITVRDVIGAANQ